MFALTTHVVFRVSITGLDEDLTTTINDTFVPMPRLWKSLCDKPNQAWYEMDVTLAIDRMTPSKLEELAAITQSLSMDEVSDKLCLIRWMDPADTESLHTIAPITLGIESRLRMHFQYLNQLEIIMLYKEFAKHPCLCALAGMLFEPLGHQLLEKKIMLNIIPMVQLDSMTGNPQWHSSHHSFPNRDAKVRFRTKVRT